MTLSIWIRIFASHEEIGVVSLFISDPSSWSPIWHNSFKNTTLSQCSDQTSSSSMRSSTYCSPTHQKPWIRLGADTCVFPRLLPSGSPIVPLSSSPAPPSSSFSSLYSPSQLPKKIREFHMAWMSTVVSKFPLLTYKRLHVQPRIVKGMKAVGER